MKTCLSLRRASILQAMNYTRFWSMLILSYHIITNFSAARLCCESALIPHPEGVVLGSAFELYLLIVLFMEPV